MASANLDLVRSIYADWERGDFSVVEWAHPEIEYVVLRAAGFPPSSAKGRTEMRETARANIEVWAQLRIAAKEYRELDSERVLVLDDRSGRGKRSGLGDRAVLGRRGSPLPRARRHGYKARGLRKP